jgi:hypothetical protein
MKHFRLVQKSKVLVGDILYSDYKELCTFVAENKEEALEKAKQFCEEFGVQGNFKGENANLLIREFYEH